MRSYLLRTVVALVTIATLTHAIRADEPQKTKRIRIALAESLFRDSPTGMAKPMVQAFGAMVRAQSGLETEIVASGDKPRDLGRKICENEVQFGIFQGVEYAWAKEKHPELRPLMIIINRRPQRYGVLIVRDDSKLAAIADLKGKALCMPLHSRCHCELFLERGCGGDVKRFCSRFERPNNSEDALDDVVDGRFDAVLLDEVALESYERRKPARAKLLKVIQKSEAFPPSVVAYRPGRTEASQLKQFQDGMLKSHETVLGRHLMMLWRMTSFERVPDDLDRQLDEILKAYPAPAGEK